MTIPFKTSADAYAAHDRGIRNSYDSSDAYLVGRFISAEDEDAHPFQYRVPAVSHVWEYLILPTLDLTAPIDEATIRADLATLRKRYDGGQGRRTPRPGHEHLDDARDVTRKLSPYYAGLYAALHLHPAPGVDFDREAYLSALFAYGRGHRDRALNPAKNDAERMRAYRARKARRDAIAILDAFDAALDAGDIVLDEPISRVALSEAIGMDLDIRVSDRRVFEVIRAAALSGDLGVDLSERQVTFHEDDGTRTRARAFVFTTAATQSPQEPPMDLISQTAAMHDAADAADRLTASLERLHVQQERMLAGDRLGALQAQRTALYPTTRPEAVASGAEPQAAPSGVSNVIPFPTITRAA